MVEPIDQETRIMEGVRFSPNFVAGWNSCLFAIRSNPLERVSHKEAARKIEEAAKSITTKEAATALLVRAGVIKAEPQPVEHLPEGFNREDLEQVIKYLESKPSQLSVDGVGSDDHATMIETSESVAARFIRAILDTSSVKEQK